MKQTHSINQSINKKPVQAYLQLAMKQTHSINQSKTNSSLLAVASDAYTLNQSIKNQLKLTCSRP
jgi:hypothetical protein